MLQITILIGKDGLLSRIDNIPFILLTIFAWTCQQRYFTKFLSLFAAGDDITASDDDRRMNLAACVAIARSACKLRYIIGCAPVIYGVPAQLLYKNVAEKYDFLSESSI